MKFTELRELLVQAAKKYVTQEEAEYFADEVIETDIRKPPRKKYRQGIIDDLKTWHGASAVVRKTIDLPSYTQYDFQGLGPSIKIKEIHDELEKKARAQGIAMVSIINSGGMHTTHLWTQGLAKRGMFALCAFNGGPDAVVPFNGTKGIFGTNPLSYGFPSDKGEVVVDMATSEIPYFKIVDAKKNHTQLPLNTAVDSDGELTTDPEQAMNDQEVSNLLPMGGGYKGYCINYLVEMMTSALIGARASSEMSHAYIETEHGGFIIAIAIDQVTDRKKYDASMKSMNETIRAQKPKNGIQEVIVPGDTNNNRRLVVEDQVGTELYEEYRRMLKDM